MKANKDQLFNSFVYGKGNKVVWTPTSNVSKELSAKSEIKSMLDDIEESIRSHFIVHKNLGKGFYNNDSLMQKSEM
ncbi:MAG: hypothetical protein IPJ54_09990 [Saprospiraceae bacterium]|nr:hypothetical protein [Saprospiraceae bacterium]